MSTVKVNLWNFSAGTRSACTELHTKVWFHCVRNAFTPLPRYFQDRLYDTVQVDITLTKFRPPYIPVTNIPNIFLFLDNWLTVHHTSSITLVDLQLDAQNSYLFTYNTFIKILHMFRALACPSSEGLRRNGVLS
jgi:hypothetical protein